MTDEPPVIDPGYIAARRVLLDALTALAPQGKAVIVAGAQAIYLRTGGGDVAIAVAPFTTDGDLALDPGRLVDSPELEAVMGDAGFELLRQEGGHIEPGIWIARTVVAGTEYEVPIDLIVPEGVAAGGGRRGARLGVHGKRAARRAVGLEAALIDNDPMTISALEAGDGRSIVTSVAGVAALFVA